MSGLSDEAFFGIVRLGFGSRRKQLFGCLRDRFDTVKIEAAFRRAKIDQKARGEDLSLAQWVALSTPLLN